MPNTQKTKKHSHHNGYPHPIENYEKKEEVPLVKVAWITQFGTITVSILACIATVLGTILAFPPVVKYFQDTPTPTMIPSPTSTFLPTLLPSETPDMAATPFFIPNTETPTLLPTSTEFPTSLPSPISSESPAQKMMVRLDANTTSGKAPLQVNMSAQNSFMQLANGITLPCGQLHLCNYVWTVYDGGKQIGKPVTGDGTFNYIFNRKGEYFVTVFVCRGNVCEDDGTTIEVR